MRAPRFRKSLADGKARNRRATAIGRRKASSQISSEFLAPPHLTQNRDEAPSAPSPQLDVKCVVLKLILIVWAEKMAACNKRSVAKYSVKKPLARPIVPVMLSSLVHAFSFRLRIVFDGRRFVRRCTIAARRVCIFAAALTLHPRRQVGSGVRLRLGWLLGSCIFGRSVSCQVCSRR